MTGLHSRRDTAEILDISEDSLDRFTAVGLIGFHRVGSLKKYSDEQIKAFRDSTEVKPKVTKMRRSA